MRKNAKGGRPAFAPTADMRRKVSNAAGGGMSHEEIALGLGISRNTLEKHFEHELSVGAYAKRVEVLDAMQRTAKKGNVAAQKAYLQMTPALAAPPAEIDKPAEPKRGKKEQAAVDATTAQTGTDWADLLPNGAAPH